MLPHSGGCTHRNCISSDWRGSVPRFAGAPARLASARVTTVKPFRHLSTRSRCRQVCRASLGEAFQVSDHWRQITGLLTPLQKTRAQTCVQNVLHTALQPHPGLASGVLVNSTVYVVGLQILLKGVSSLLM